MKRKKIRSKGPKGFFAFTDEAGNTGDNLFDQNQPTFWTCTTLSETDLDSENKAFIQDCQNILGVRELHAKDIGFEGIEKIADKLKKFLDIYITHIIFVKIDKQFLAATKLCDTLLDSADNKAISPHQYFTTLKGILEIRLIPLIKRKDRIAFWDSYKTGNRDGFIKILEQLQFRVVEHIQDQRTKEVLGDALSWAIRNPSAFFYVKRDKGDSPNLVSLLTLLNSIHDFRKATKFKIKKFVHDEQSQFGKYMKEAFELVKNVTDSDDPIKNLIGLNEFKRVETFDCAMEFKASDSSVGLQVVDCILWLTKRGIERGIPRNAKECQILFQFIFNRGIIENFSYDNYERRVLKDYQKLMKSVPLGFQNLPEAEKIKRKFEFERVTRMTSHSG